MIYDNGFYNEADLINALEHGCEVEFAYEGKKYSITHTSDCKVSVTEYNRLDSEKTYPCARKAMEYIISDKKLKEIISEIKIIDRSF